MAYKAHHRAWLMVAAVFFVPVAFVESLFVAGVEGPVIAAEIDAEVRAEEKPPPSRVELVFRSAATNFLIGLLLHGLALGLSMLAVSLAFADRIAGRQEPPAWDELTRALVVRVPTLLIQLAPAGVLVGVGLALLVLPGIAAACLVAFVPAVVVFEKQGGVAAIRRSLALVTAAPGAVIAIVGTIASMRIVARIFADMLMPDSGHRVVVFFTHFLGDLFFLVAAPLAAMALTRLYIEIRQERDGLDPVSLARAP